VIKPKRSPMERHIADLHGLAVIGVDLTRRCGAPMALALQLITLVR
jgi:hypothetical protein